MMRRLWVKTVGEERFIYCYQQGREGAAEEIKRARGCSKGAARRRRRPTGTKTQEGEKKEARTRRERWTEADRERERDGRMDGQTEGGSLLSLTSDGRAKRSRPYLQSMLRSGRVRRSEGAEERRNEGAREQREQRNEGSEGSASPEPEVASRQRESTSVEKQRLRTSTTIHPPKKKQRSRKRRSRRSPKHICMKKKSFKNLQLWSLTAGVSAPT